MDFRAQTLTVPMHAGHILLGRPWQFDRKVNLDGFKNRHSFVKDTKLIDKNTKDKTTIKSQNITGAMAIGVDVLCLSVTRDDNFFIYKTI